MSMMLMVMVVRMMMVVMTVKTGAYTLQQSWLPWFSSKLFTCTNSCDAHTASHSRHLPPADGAPQAQEAGVTFLESPSQ